MAITASFSSGTGILTASGDGLANNVTASRNGAGTILVNGGAVPVAGGPATVVNTSRIDLFGQGGNDTLAVDETNGAMPAANMFGGIGNDVLVGGSGGDQLFGQDGNDSLFGKGGADLLFGGNDNDVLTGGAGDDQMFGEAGNDTMIWNPGDGTDLMEGGDGTDTAQVNGGNGDEVFTATANGTRVRFDRISPAPFSIDIGTSEALVVNMNGGNDSFSATGNLAALISLIVDGGAGNDTILGGNGIDTLLGGDGNDFIDGNQGNDIALLGAGDDSFQWDPGDGSDTVDGQAGNDTLLFNASNANEIMDVLANGSHARVLRNVGNIVMDINGIEHVAIHALGGIDAINVNDLTGTGIASVDINLEGSVGTNTADAQVDTTTVNGTAGNDLITIAGSGTSAVVTGLAAQVTIANAFATDGDSLVVNGLDGNDTISATGLAAGVLHLTIDGGAGNDTIVGGDGADLLLGGDGNDSIRGGRGDDVALMGAGNDTFTWNPGDGNDVVEGQTGIDTLEFNGANINENFNIAANGGRVRFTRDVANVTMDMNDTEILRLNGLSGNNTLTVGDLSGTDLALVVYTGGTGPDTINAALAFTDIQATGGDDNDNFTTGAGADVLDGGAGNDTIIAGAGNDIIVGGAGADALAGGAGDDIFRFFAGAELVGGEVLAGQNGIHDAVQLINTGNIDFAAVTFGGIETVQFLAGNSSASFNAGQLGDVANVVGGAGVDRFIVNGSNIDLGGLAFSSWNPAVDQIILVGTAGSDNLAGTNLADVFISGLGANVLNGRFGNDLYYLNDGSATIIDAGGLDTIVSTITRSLAALPAIERLVLGGTLPSTVPATMRPIPLSATQPQTFSPAASEPISCPAAMATTS